MRTIHKFRLPLSGEVEMPVGAQILSVAAQREEPRLWALVDTDNPTEVRRFVAIGTGQDADITRLCSFVGDYRLMGGLQVYHVFELHRLAPERTE